MDQEPITIKSIHYSDNDLAREIAEKIALAGVLNDKQVIRVGEPFYGVFTVWLADGTSITVTATVANRIGRNREDTSPD